MIIIIIFSHFNSFNFCSADTSHVCFLSPVCSQCSQTHYNFRSSGLYKKWGVLDIEMKAAGGEKYNL